MTYATMFKSGGNSENLRTTFNALRTMVRNALTGDYCRSTPSLQIGTSSKKAVRNNAAFTFNINGMPYSKAAAETAFTATTHDVADGYTRIFTVQISAAGTITFSPGTAVLTANASTAEGGAVTADNAKIGEVKIAADGAIFNATTDDLDASHLTVTYTNWDIATQSADFALTEN